MMYGNILGYKKGADGKPEIVPEEAEIVRRIYSWHREGRSLRSISKTLADMGIKSPRGHSKWSIETIRKILNNEKYYGNVLLQKTYISNLRFILSFSHYIAQQIAPSHRLSQSRMTRRHRLCNRRQTHTPPRHWAYTAP